MTAGDLHTGHLYSAKKPSRAKGGYWNDRRIVGFRPTIGGMRVLYKSPAVIVGHPFTEEYTEHYGVDGSYTDNEEDAAKSVQRERTFFVDQSGVVPDSVPASCSVEDFLLFAKEDITEKVNTEWRR